VAQLKPNSRPKSSGFRAKSRSVYFFQGFEKGMLCSNDEQIVRIYGKTVSGYYGLFWAAIRAHRSHQIAPPRLLIGKKPRAVLGALGRCD
jgi:hypothetical protein